MKRNENDMTQRRWIQIKSLSSQYDSCWATNSKAFKCIQSKSVYIQHHTTYFTSLPALSTSLNHLGWLVLAGSGFDMEPIPRHQGTKLVLGYLHPAALERPHQPLRHPTRAPRDAQKSPKQNPSYCNCNTENYDYEKYLKTKGLNDIVVKNT